MEQGKQGHEFMNWIRQHIVIHPLLFAVAPMVSLISHNPEIEPLYGLRAILLLGFGSMLALVLLQRIIPDKHRAAMVCSLFLLLFFSYGHVIFGLVTKPMHGFLGALGLLGNHLTLALTWIALFIAGSLISARVKVSLRKLTSIMNVMAVATVLVPFTQVARYELGRRQPVANPASASAPLADAVLSDEEKPDFYYIILDGYARSDTLMQLYSFDNTPFLSFLKDQSFAIQPECQSNYILTSLSLSSSLNMDYLQNALPAGADSRDAQLTLSRMIRDNAVWRILKRLGYQTVAFDTGYRTTELRNADYFLKAPLHAINPLEALLLETSGFAAYQELAEAIHLPYVFPGYESHRERVTSILDMLPGAAEIPGPKFVFAHIVLPHPPFIFDEGGGSVTPPFRYTLMDGDAFPGTEEQYIQGYVAQLKYLNHRLQELIPELQSRSHRPTIIILQGDHGPGMQLSYDSAQDSNLEERLRILCAVYSSDAEITESELALTPVNLFRVLFNQAFQTDYALLPDRSYYSSLNAPLDFVEYP